MEPLADESCWTPHRKILTSGQTQLPWLQLFGIQNSEKADKPLTRHIHPDCMEIVFLLKGFQIYEVAGHLFRLTGYDVFVTLANEPHSSGNFPERISDLMWFQLRLSALLRTFQDQRIARLADALQELPRTFRGNAVLESQLRESFFCLASTDSITRVLGQELFIGCLCRLILLSRQVKPLQADQISEAIAYIHEHIREPITLEDAAASCGLSLSRFKSKFKEETGITPRTFINYVKIANARELLRKGLSVTEVSGRLAFDTPNYFATLFRKYTGRTPSQYRNSPSQEDEFEQSLRS